MKKILIIDDNRHMTTYLEGKLREAGHEVYTVANGMAAVKTLTDVTPDIIFIDYFLPNLNGDKLCQIIRKMDHLKNAYLVIMSAAATELQLDPAKIGANASLAKGTFQETAKYFFSVIASAQQPPHKMDSSGMMGVDAVQPRQLTVELLGKNRHLQAVLDSISEGIVETYCGQIVYANPAAAAIFGISQDQLLAASPQDLFDESYRSKVESLMMAGVTGDAPIGMMSPINLGGKTLSMKKLPFRDDADTIILLVTDITERLRAEESLRSYQDHLEVLVKERTADLERISEKLQQVQKMEAIGLLAGGVAHDLNNILSGIVSYPDLLLLEIPADSPLRRIALAIQDSGEKAAAVVQDLLTLARRGVAAFDVINLNSIISEYLKSPEYNRLTSLYPNVRLQTNLEEDLFNILGSSVHVSKTITNLALNAAEAMPDGGTIFLSTENRYIDRPINGHDEIAEGDYVTLTITDTGVGISPGDIEKIFEPFYTKKIMGRSGTGLGMAVVWGTVKDHKGYIDVRSTVGKGTSCVLYFPVTRKELRDNRSLISIEDYKGKGEAILVVDDIEEQRTIASMILTALGYSVSTVASGEEAITFIKKNPVDVIMLDMIMEPGMDGLETYRHIRKLRPQQRAIITSGFSESERVKEAQRLGAGEYIKKPYTLEKIARALRYELNR